MNEGKLSANSGRRTQGSGHARARTHSVSMRAKAILIHAARCPRSLQEYCTCMYVGTPLSLHTYAHSHAAAHLLTTFIVKTLATNLCNFNKCIVYVGGGSTIKNHAKGWKVRLRIKSMSATHIKQNINSSCEELMQNKTRFYYVYMYIDQRTVFFFFLEGEA